MSTCSYCLKIRNLFLPIVLSLILLSGLYGVISITPVTAHATSVSIPNISKLNIVAVALSDLTITKVATPDTAIPGDTITYTIVFSNGGPDVATSVILTDSIPVNVSVASIISSGVAITQTSPGYVWAVQDLALGEGGMITITGQITDSIAITSTINNSVEITTLVDGDSSNNTSDVDVTVTPTGNCYATPDDGTTVYQHSTALAVADAGDGGTVKVAGYCAGVDSEQVLDLNNNITILGAYTHSDWSTAQPGTHVTTLDAVQGGRVVNLGGGITVTLESLTLTGGQITGNGAGINNPSGSTVILSNTIVTTNTATSNGGGIYNTSSGSVMTLINSAVSNNTASSDGGGFIYQIVAP